MIVFVAFIFLLVLVSLALYLYGAGVFNTPYLRTFQFAFYILLVFFALTIGISIFFHDRPATPLLSVSEILPVP